MRRETSTQLELGEDVVERRRRRDPKRKELHRHPEMDSHAKLLSSPIPTPHLDHTNTKTTVSLSSLPSSMEVLTMSSQEPLRFDMQSLLSASESHAFQSFLSSVDYADESISAAEWEIYASSMPMQTSEDDDSQRESRNPEHREALIKATKDLMSLDAERWPANGFSMDQRADNPRQHYEQPAGHQLSGRQNISQQQLMLQHEEQQRHRHQLQHEQEHSMFATGRDNFPFLQSKSQEMQHRHQQPSHESSSSATPTSPGSPYGFPQHNSMAMDHHHQQQPSPLQGHLVSIRPPTSGSSSSRPKRLHSAPAVASSSSSSRPNLHPSSAHQSSSSSISTITTHQNGGIQPNGTTTTKRARVTASPALTVPSNASGGSAAKQALLSPSQKKANHIQSEQKRRANIRRGYEALCETVPALREAIKEEEDAMDKGHGRGAPCGGGGTGKKKTRGKKGQNQKDEDKERLDGRAGPRSENVVLSKTIEHIQALLADRSSLLARLHRGRTSLPPGHSALTSLVSDPPWEREWKGGEGKLEDGEDDEGGSESDE